MKQILRVACIIGMGTLPAIMPASSYRFDEAFRSASAFARPHPTNKTFFVFDGTLYVDKPNLSLYGIRPITIIYAGRFGSDWRKDPESLPNDQSVQAVAREASQKGNLVVLDIEHWPLDGNVDVVRDNVKKYMTVLQWFREAAPGLSVGFYGAPPLRDYWRTIKPRSTKEHQAWMEGNDQIRPLAMAVDAFFPSLYAFYTDQSGWKTYAVAQIEEARRYGNGKPVYVFLWPQYHESNRRLGGQYLSADYWTLQLETAREHADGIVLWSGSEPWNEESPWWKVTKEFMKIVHVARSNSSSPPEGL